MARKVQLLTSLGNTSSHVKHVFEELAERFEIHFAWGWGSTGDHNRGRALDIMAYDFGTVAKPGRIRPGFNEKVKDYLLKHRDRLGVKYIIWDQTIISRSPKSVTGVNPWAEKRYTGTSHANHVHVSFVDSPPAYKPPASSLYIAYPGAAHFKIGNESDTIGRLNHRLKARGAKQNRTFTESTRKAYQSVQVDYGYKGADADGYPGEASWTRLKLLKTEPIAAPPAPKPEPVPDAPSVPVPAPAPAPAPSAPSADPAELDTPMRPAQLVQAKGEPAVYAVGLRVVHVVSPEHLSQLREQGWVSDDIKEVSKAHLASLLRKPLV